MADRPVETVRTDESYRAEDGRKQWSELLNATQWEGKHVTITRSSRRAAVMVPPDWYDRAHAALADHDRAPKKRA